MAADGAPAPLADPERALAVAYAPAGRRRALATLFAVDERLGAVVAATREEGIGRIRLAWWREALERLDAAPPPAEPLLVAVAREILPLGVGGTALAELEQGWAALLDQPMEADAIARFGEQRGATLFTLAARLLDGDDPRLPACGTGWALADLSYRHSDAAVRAEARRQAVRAFAGWGGRWSRAARPLAALAALARRDMLVAAPRAQGSPARLARMLAMRLTGR